MNFSEMYRLFQTINDKAASAYWTPESFDQMANIAYDTWTTMNYKVYEQSELAKYKLRILYGLSAPILNTNVVSFTTDIPTAKYITRANATFKKTCTIGKVPQITYPTKNIVPTQNNRIDINESDPFNKGIDDDPRAIQSVDATGSPILQIFSETTPTQIVCGFIRNLQTIDYTNSPNTVFELPNDLAREICIIIDISAESIIENYSKMQAIQQMIAPKLAP